MDSTVFSWIDSERMWILGLNYMQSVTQNTALGCEVYYIDEQRKSGLGVAARRATDQYIATFQASTVGLISASYLHKIGEKVNFQYEALERDVSLDVVDCGFFVQCEFA